MRKTGIDFLLLFLVVVSLSLLSDPCEALTVRKVQVKGLYSIGEEEFLDMFGVREGSAINRDIIRTGIKRTFLKGIFEDIAVEVTGDENPELIIEVRERDFIDKIDIDGDYELPTKTIKKLFPLKEDQEMRYDLLDQASMMLRQDLIFYGFPEADIHARAVKKDSPYRTTIYLTVHTGAPSLVKKILISGSDSDVKQVMKLSDGDVYNQHVLAEDFSRIKKYFKEKGYFSPAVGPYTYKEGELEIIVDPGKLLRVTFYGNNVIPTKKLMREVHFFDIETFNDAVTDEVVSRMVSLYHGKGYSSAQVAPVIETDDKETAVTFFVYEGEKLTVSSVQFIGITLPPERLKSVMSLREDDAFNPDLIESDMESLNEFYGTLGYLEASVKDIRTVIDEESGTVELIVDITEGEKTEIASVEIIGIGPEVNIGIEEGDPYNEVNIVDARFKILDFYRTHGFSNIDVDVIRTIEDHGVSLVFDVKEGSKQFFGKTIIIGNRKTRFEVIRRELVHSEGQPYSFRLLSADRQNLYKLGIFSDVEIKAIDGEGNTKDVVVRVQEGSAGSVDVGLGYATYERFRGFLEISYRNFWGMNRVGTFRTELSSLEERFILRYREPWFMGKRLPFSAFVLYENKEEINIDTRDTRYRLERYAVTAGVEKQLTEKFKVELYYELSRNKTTDVDPDVVLSKEDVGTLRISSLKPGIVYDTRDDPFDPKSGMIAGASLKVAPDQLFSESNFIKLSVYGGVFHELNKRIVFATDVRGGMAYRYDGTDELPLVERFFLGGRFSVRGYEQDSLGPKGEDGEPTGGNAFLMSNVELRISITKNIGVVTFLDLGNVWLETNDMDLSDLKYTSGLGFRYRTPVGPIRLDYGYKLNREPDESSSEIHFSIGHAF